MPEEHNDESFGELRKFYRLDSVHFVSYMNVTPTEFGIKDGLATTQNISTGGILLITEVPFPKSTILSMEMAVKDELIFAKGIVVRCIEAKDEPNKYELGIRFTEIDDDSKNIIARLIAKSMLSKSKAEPSVNDVD
jgi:c-di-GMP-binding flagellar brake protein YcgR